MCRLVVVDSETHKVDYIHSFDKETDANAVKALWELYLDTDRCEIYVLKKGQRIKRKGGKNGSWSS